MRARRYSQLLFLALFGYLLMAAKYGWPPALQADIFLRANPLLGGVSMISSRSLLIKALPAFLLLLLTLVLGRFFCGWVCPLGSIHEFFHAFLVRRGLSNFKRETSNVKRETSNVKRKTLNVRLREPLLIFILTAALFSVSFVWLFDPLATLTRTFAMGLRSSAALAVLLGAVLLAIVALNLIGRRFWCRNLCPLGGLLGLLARFNIFQRRVGEECNDCLACQEACPVGMSPSRYLKGECLQCRSCLRACPVEAIAFETRWPQPGPGEAFDLSRRGFLASLGLGVMGAVFVKVGLSSTAYRSQRSVIRPPGALEEGKFVAACVRCGKCVQACPTGGLRPTLLEAGIEGLLTPRLIPRVGPCQADCLRCGQVCPSGAIRELTAEEKRITQIGLAGIDRQHCLWWTEGATCLVCSQVCPYEAIEFHWTKDGYHPVVKEWLCTGCGICEYRCPVEGPAAITVLATRG